MKRPECPPTENIVRAICTAHWDTEKQRFSSSLFTGPNTSVGRLIILPLNGLFVIFHRELDKLPDSKVLAAGQINVGQLQEIGNSHNEPKSITVEIAPLHTNPAHAEIPQKLPRSLALKIIKELKIHNDPY